MFGRAASEYGMVNMSKVNDILQISTVQIAGECENLYSDILSFLLSVVFEDPIFLTETFSLCNSVTLEELKDIADELRKRETKMEMPSWMPISGKDLEKLYSDLILLKENGENNIEIDDYKDFFATVTDIQTKKILVRGHPGIGKSTFCKKIFWDWSNGILGTFTLVFLVSKEYLKIVKEDETIEKLVIRQYPFLEGLKVKEEKIAAIFETFGSRCLLIIDGFDEQSLAKNQDLNKIIKGQRFVHCNVLLTSRLHSSRVIRRYFDTVVRVDGFSQNEAQKFAYKILEDKKKVQNIFDFSHLNSNQKALYTFPILLIFICFLTKMKEIDVLNKMCFTGEIYTRILRCLYKTYTTQNNNEYCHKKFALVMKLFGKFAFKILVNKNYLYTRKEVTDEVCEDVFEYGILSGDTESGLLLHDETTDIYVTFIHPSMEEFFGALHFVDEICNERPTEELCGTEPIFMRNPLFLHFCLWFLYSNQTYFPFTNEQQQHARQSLTKYTRQCIERFDLMLPKIVESFPAINIEAACSKNDQLSLKFFSEILEQYKAVNALVVESRNTMTWIFQSFSSLLTSTNSIVIDQSCSLSSMEKSTLVLRAETLNDAALETIIKRWKYLHKYNSIYLYTDRDSVDLSKLLSHLQRGDMTKLEIGAYAFSSSDVVMDEMLSFCSNLTHLFINNQHIQESVIWSISDAVQVGNLPHLSHLGFIKCCGLDKKIELLFKSPWPRLINLNLYGCLLDVSDYDALSKVINSKSILPKLNLLVVSVAALSKEIFPQITNMTTVSGKIKSLFLDALSVHRSVQIIDLVQCYKDRNLTSFGLSLQRENNLPNRFGENSVRSLTGVESLALHSCISNHDDLTTMIRHTSLRRLSYLDISRSLGIAGNLCILLRDRFPSLNTLILSNCELNTNDLRSLADANMEGRLPRLRHLDVSKNEKIDKCLDNLFPRLCVWRKILSLNLIETMHQDEQLDAFVKSIPSLQELMVSTYPEKEVTAKWFHLQKLCISECNEEMLTNMADAVEKGLFPVLESVCINRTSPTFRGKIWNLHNSEAFHKLVKNNVSCHVAVLSEQPFIPSKCVCKVTERPVRWSIPWGTTCLVCAAGLIFLSVYVVKSNVNIMQRACHCN